MILSFIYPFFLLSFICRYVMSVAIALLHFHDVVVSSVYLFFVQCFCDSCSAFEFFGTMLCSFAEHPGYRAQNREKEMKRKKNISKNCNVRHVIHERNPKCRGIHTHRETVKDHLRYWYWYDTNRQINRFSFYLFGGKEGRDEKRSDRGLVTFLPFFLLCVFIYQMTISITFSPSMSAFEIILFKIIIHFELVSSFFKWFFLPFSLQNISFHLANLFMLEKLSDFFLCVDQIPWWTFNSSE